MINFIIFIFYVNKNIIKLYKLIQTLNFIYWGLGIGDWGLGFGDWAQSPIPNPQSPIPNPHLIIFLLT